MKRVDAAQFVTRNGFPSDEGKILAEQLMALPDPDWDDLHVDCWHLSAGMTISAFFNGFLQKVFEVKPHLLDKARAIHWDLRYPFQREQIVDWMKDFKPFSGYHTESYTLSMGLKVIKALLEARLPFHVTILQQDESASGLCMYGITVEGRFRKALEEITLAVRDQVNEES